MPATASAAPLHVQQIVQSVRSDALPHLVAFLQRIEVLREHVAVQQVDLIVDANVVIGDLLWLATKRTNPATRTHLQELMDCKVVRAHAPYYLNQEIRVNLPEVAEKMKADLGLMRALWKEYRKQIRFVAVGGPPKASKLRDPKDVPYLRLQKKLSHPIVSADADVAAMGGNVVRVEILPPLRAYSRNAAIEYQLKMTGVGSLMMAGGVVNMVNCVLKSMRNLPPWVRWGALILVALALANPKSREKIWEVAKGAFHGVAFVLEAVFGVVMPVIQEHQRAQEKAQLALAEARAEFPALTSRSNVE